jgi:hypothetical protein
VVDRERAREVGQEDERALEDGDDDEVAAGVILPDLGPELGDPRLNLACGEVDVADRGIGGS